MKKLICTLGIIFGVAQVWAMQKEGGEPPLLKRLKSECESSSAEVELIPGSEGMSDMEETPANSHDKWIESHASLRELACDAIVNKDKVRSLIEALSNDSLSADIIEKVFWDLQDKELDYTAQYDDFMEISNLLGTVSYEKCEGYCVGEQSLLDSYNRGEFKEIETGGPFDGFEP